MIGNFDERTLKELLFDTFERHDTYEDIIDEIRSVHSCNDITDEEYNFILKNYDTWLDEWLKERDKKQAITDTIFREDKLEDLVIELKTIESKDTYEELFNSGYNGRFLGIFEAEQKEGKTSFEEIRKYAVEKLGTEILTYLKGVF